MGQQRGRYRTMKVAGYTLTAMTLALGIPFIPLHMARREHVSHYGRASCTPDIFPVLGAAALIAGLTVGALGSVRDRELTRKHGTVAPLRSPWRTALAGLGVGAATGIMASSLALTAFCNS